MATTQDLNCKIDDQNIRSVTFHWHVIPTKDDYSDKFIVRNIQLYDIQAKTRVTLVGNDPGSVRLTQYQKYVFTKRGTWADVHLMP